MGPSPEQIRRAFFPLIMFVMFFGTLFLLAGIGLFVREYLFGREAISTTGTIVLVYATPDPEGETRTPVVEFQSPAGETIRFHGQSKSPSPAKGTVVPVLFQPTNPKKAQIDTFADRWLFPTVFTSIGTALLLACLGLRKLTGVIIAHANSREGDHSQFIDRK